MIETLKWAALIAGIIDLCAFAIMHLVITRYGAHVMWARVGSIIVTTCVVVAALALATVAQAGSVVDVARCTIALNEQMPSGPELRKAERECYKQLPPNVAQQAYEQRGSDERTIIIEGRLNGAGAAQRAPSYTPTPHPQLTAPALRYPYPYGPAPRHQAPYIYRTAP
jgi:hypothetical protein